MSWRLANSLTQLRSQVNTLWPNRDKSSDGSIGDQSHSQRKSDHNPNGAGVVTAIDIDADLSPTENVGVLVAKLQHSNDRRIKYIIWRGQITVKGNISQWQPYHGINGHFHHAHISVATDAKLYDSSQPWSLDGEVVAEPAHRLAKEGDRNDLTRLLQNALATRGYITKKSIDGIFGPLTTAAVKHFQRDQGIREDGLAGEITLRSLGI